MSRSIKQLKKDSVQSPYRLWYNQWIKKNATGKVLDVGKSKFWDYNFPTIDTNSSLNPTFVGNIEKTIFPNNYFDIVLCNGMYEFVKNQQAMINEVLRITKIGGKAIFGFVGKSYKPYRKPWKYYEKEEVFLNCICQDIDFSDEYHFIICQKLKSIRLSPIRKILLEMI